MASVKVVLAADDDQQAAEIARVIRDCGAMEYQPEDGDPVTLNVYSAEAAG
jgi:hypothetical protein